METRLESVFESCGVYELYKMFLFLHTQLFDKPSSGPTFFFFFFCLNPKLPCFTLWQLTVTTWLLILIEVIRVLWVSLLWDVDFFSIYGYTYLINFSFWDFLVNVLRSLIRVNLDNRHLPFSVQEFTFTYRIFLSTSTRFKHPNHPSSTLLRVNYRRIKSYNFHSITQLSLLCLYRNF